MEETRNGIVEPKASHNNPVNNEPSIIAKLESIVSKPIAVARLWSGIKSDTQAFAIPSVDAA